MKLFSVIVFLIFASGCAATWPAACIVEPVEMAGKTENMRRCKCETFKFRILPSSDGAPSPAGRVLVECDGHLVPFQVNAATIKMGQMTP